MSDNLVDELRDRHAPNCHQYSSVDEDVGAAGDAILDAADSIAALEARCREQQEQFERAKNILANIAEADSNWATVINNFLSKLTPLETAVEQRCACHGLITGACPFDVPKAGKPPLPGHGEYCICDKCMAYYAPKSETSPEHEADCDITLHRNSMSNEIGRCTCSAKNRK